MRTVFIQGCPDDLPAARNALQQAGYRVAATEADADGTLFCVSGRQTMKSVILSLDRSARPLTCLIHGPGTHAAVGSLSGKTQGYSIPWPTGSQDHD
jgi:hypothetical protein